MTTQLKLLTTKDLTNLMPILSRVTAQMATLHIPQWQGDYPNELTFQQDIKNQVGYGFWQTENLIGYGALVTGSDPNYQVIDGQWLNKGPYAAIHRTFIDPALTGAGLGTKLLTRLVEEAQTIPISSIRIDTHEKNQLMRHLIERLGFQYCGIVKMVDDGTERLAYERLC